MAGGVAVVDGAFDGVVVGSVAVEAFLGVCARELAVCAWGAARLRKGALGLQGVAVPLVEARLVSCLERLKENH